MRMSLRIAIVAAALALPAGAAASTSLSAQSSPFVVLDAIGPIALDSPFSLFGSGGMSISASQLVGPEFTLTQPSRITELGAFVNNCEAVVMGTPLCPDTHPFAVEIRASIGGVPDPLAIVARFELTHDDDPLYVAYEYARPQLVLPAGRYFALVSARAGESGFLLASASVPFEYRSRTANMGLLLPDSGLSFASEQYGAIRIIGEPLSAIEQLVLLRTRFDDLDVATGGLAAKVAAAQTLLARDRPVGACAVLGAFEFELAAHGAELLSEALAAELLVSVRTIEESIPC